MLSSYEYYSYINNNFLVKNEELFRECHEDKHLLLPLPDGLFDNLLSLLNQVQQCYEFNMQKMCLPNFNKFVIWQKERNGIVDYKKILVATEFVVFCCLADKILDSQRFSDDEKEKVCQKLNIKLFLSEKEYKSEYFVEMDQLLNDIRVFLIDKDTQKCPFYSLIVNKMEKAFKSEIYMSNNYLLAVQMMNSEEMHLLIDKSVEFEMAAFLLASVSATCKNTLKVAKYIANIFWIIDDLCDFVDDIRGRRMNSALFYCSAIGIEMQLSDRVEIAYANIDIFINELEKNIFALKDTVGEALFCYVLNEVWEWCSDVRKMAKE